jgi:hypothetical protein
MNKRFDHRAWSFVFLKLDFEKPLTIVLLWEVLPLTSTKSVLYRPSWAQTSLLSFSMMSLEIRFIYTRVIGKEMIYCPYSVLAANLHQAVVNSACHAVCKSSPRQSTTTSTFFIMPWHLIIMQACVRHLFYLRAFSNFLGNTHASIPTTNLVSYRITPS